LTSIAVSDQQPSWASRTSFGDFNIHQRQGDEMDTMQTPDTVVTPPPLDMSPERDLELVASIMSGQREELNKVCTPPIAVSL